MFVLSASTPCTSVLVSAFTTTSDIWLQVKYRMG